MKTATIPVRTNLASFEELLAQITKENRPALADFGEAVGKETW